MGVSIRKARSVAVVVGLVCAAWVPPARALHRETPFMLAIPGMAASGTQSEAPFVQGEAARWVAFHSSSDLLGTGSSGREIFLFDNAPPRSLSQITNCAVGESGNPSTVANGKTIVFDSTSDLAAPLSRRCRSELPRRQVFRAVRRQTGIEFTQLTNTNADCRRPRISMDGHKIAFECTGDLLQNGSSGTHIFLWRRREICDFRNRPMCNRSLQLTPVGASGESGHVVFNAQGNLLAFNSNMPIDGWSNGFQQLWLWEIVQAAPFPAPVRLTNGMGDSIKPSMNEDGRLVAFQSQADLLGNGSTGWEIFLLDRQTGRLRQLTNGPWDSTDPSLGSAGRYLVYVSSTDGSGPHLFLYDLLNDVVYQVTRDGPGSAGHPIATANTIFFFDSDENPLEIPGLSGRMIYALNVFRQLPPRSLRAVKARLLPGTRSGGGGSSVRIVTRSTEAGDPRTSYIRVPIGDPVAGAGELALSVLTRNIDGEGLVKVSSVVVPPIFVPSFGAVCFEQVGQGQGTIDCDGGRPGVDYRILQDHVTNNPSGPYEDPFCELGCREGSGCPSPFRGPGGGPCPRCLRQVGACAEGRRAGESCTFDTECPGRERVVDPTTGTVLVQGACDLARPQVDSAGVARAGTCASGTRKGRGCDADSECPSECLAEQRCDRGPNAGSMCQVDRDCDPFGACEGAPQDVCQGPPVFQTSGTFRPGDMTLTVPMTAKISTDPGRDGRYCSQDDRYALSGIGLDSLLRLTTGRAAATIVDPDYESGKTLGASEEGAPFDCDAWQYNRDVSGGRLVGALTFLNVPSIPLLHDTILTFRFVPDPGAQCVGDRCSRPCTDDSNCNDGNACNGEEFCHLGACHGGVPISCDDGNECNGREVCDPSNGGMCLKSPGVRCPEDNPCAEGICRPDFLCVYRARPDGTPCDDGNLCTGLDPENGGPCAPGRVCDECVAGRCTAPLNEVAARLACENDNVCDGIDACDPTTGNSCIQVVPPLVCNPDGNPCTDDGCDPVLGCNPPNTAPCDDGNACTGPDVCANRACQGELTPVAEACNLGDGNFCNGIEQCDPATGACVAVPLDCDDGNPCTDEICDPLAETVVEACVYTDNTAPCDDGNACTDSDTCGGGVCTGTLSPAALTCNAGDGDLCNGVEACDPLTGACVATPLDCDDGNPCTVDSCNPVLGCENVAIVGGCDDGDACTVGDTCVDGICLGAPTPVALSCSDGDACNGAETCDPGTGLCVAGVPLDCDDGDVCTTDSCDAGSGCANARIGGLEGVLCEIEVIIDELSGSSGTIRGRRLSGRLRKLALRARALVELASRVADAKALRLLGAADGKLERLDRLTTRANARDRIPDHLNHLLSDRAREARRGIAALRAALRGMRSTEVR